MKRPNMPAVAHARIDWALNTGSVQGTEIWQDGLASASAQCAVDAALVPAGGPFFRLAGTLAAPIARRIAAPVARELAPYAQKAVRGAADGFERALKRILPAGRASRAAPAPRPSSRAESAAQYAKLKQFYRELEVAEAKSQASLRQVEEAGRAIAGEGTGKVFRDADRVARQYGGSPSEWVKMRSSSYKAPDGVRLETHWVENLRSGQRLEFKTKITGGTQ